jgi:hypothetical protein
MDMELRRNPKHLTIMNAVTDPGAKHKACLEEYRMALRMWSEIRALYYLDPAAPEVREATRHLEELERDLANFNKRPPALLMPGTSKRP